MTTKKEIQLDKLPESMTYDSVEQAYFYKPSRRYIMKFIDSTLVWTVGKYWREMSKTPMKLADELGHEYKEDVRVNCELSSLNTKDEIKQAQV